MMEKTRAIVLKMVKYGDNKVIVDMLSSECGRMSVAWRESKSGRGRTKRMYFQPLSILDVSYERLSSGRLPLLKDVRFAEPYTDIPFNPVKQSVVFFLAEFLSMAVREEQRDAALYDFVETSLLWYDSSRDMASNFHLMFLMRISLFLGFYPDIDSFSSNSCFDMRAGRFVDAVPVHRDYLMPADASRIVTLMRMSPSNMHLFRFSHEERNRIIDVLLHFYSLHIPSFRPLKSLDVLHAVFA